MSNKKKGQGVKEKGEKKNLQGWRNLEGLFAFSNIYGLELSFLTIYGDFIRRFTQFATSFIDNFSSGNDSSSFFIDNFSSGIVNKSVFLLQILCYFNIGLLFYGIFFSGITTVSFCIETRLLYGNDIPHTLCRSCHPIEFLIFEASGLY
ncbi:MAG: hypothetical protein H8E57_00115 [Candidatus Cloacimonetes bacterium]|nr:hypothetical protein [Candidatus Cloacimonadota bacterium]